MTEWTLEEVAELVQVVEVEVVLAVRPGVLRERRAEEEAVFQPGVLKTVTNGGQYWGIPHAFSTKALYINCGVVEAAGAECAITADERLARNGADPFGWGRMFAGERDSGGTLAAKLSGWYRAWSQ